MYLLGAHLPDHKLLRIALANFYGISYKTAARLCARLQLHERATVSSLTDAQVTELSAYLSSPGSIPARKPSPTSPLPLANLSEAGAVAEAQAGPSRQRDGELPASQRPSASSDPLRSIVLESDLRRQQQANIAHHRTVGSYVGRRHAGGFPVRGQRTRRNAQTARKLNRLERRQFGTYAQSSISSKASSPLAPSHSSTALSDLLGPLARLRFNSV